MEAISTSPLALPIQKRLPTSEKPPHKCKDLSVKIFSLLVKNFPYSLHILIYF